VGCGRWGKNILRDLVHLGCEVMVADSADAGQGYATAGGAARIVDHLDRLPAVDGFVVATPTVTHAAVIVALLPRQVPVFTEKPMTADAASAARLARLAPDRLFVMDKWRYHHGVEALADLARSGELGAVQGVRTVRLQWGQPHEDVDGVWILAPHDLSIGREVLGFLPEPKAAWGERGGGTAFGLYATLGETPWLNLSVSARSPVDRREVCLICEDGVALLDDAYSDHLLVIHGRPGTERGEMGGERRAFSSELPLLRELRAFVDHLQGGPPPKTSASDGAAQVDLLARLRVMAGLDREA
jgi:predicted dehydrogenase